METKATIDEWRSKNPIRIWRKKHDASLNMVAVQAGVSLTTVNNWEQGLSTPNSEHMQRLARLTGDEQIGSKWEKWKRKGPQ